MAVPDRPDPDDIIASTWGRWAHDEVVALAPKTAEDPTNRNGIPTTPYTYPLTVPYTAPAGRLIRVELRLMLATAQAGAGVLIVLRDGSTDVERLFQWNELGPTASYVVHAVGYHRPAAGAHTYGFTIRSIVGTLDVTGATLPTRLTVRDAGPLNP